MTGGGFSYSVMPLVCLGLCAFLLWLGTARMMRAWDRRHGSADED